MAIPLSAVFIWWFFIVAAGPYGNSRAAMLTLMALWIRHDDCLNKLINAWESE